jgi:L-threonylcarbamoyladenylate synthase
MAQKYLHPIPQEVKDDLINPYWPGALTIVLPCLTRQVPDLVRGGTNNLGVRVPDHPDVLDIIKNVGVPILGPSANFHGEKTPYKFEDLDKELTKQVDFILKGECATKQASTVIDCSIKPWSIIRQGATQINIY